MAAAAAAAVVTVVGTAVSIDANNQRASAEKKAAKSKAALQALQADEMLRQAEIEIDIFEDQAEEKMGDITSSYARAGVDLGSGSALLVMANSERKLKNAAAELERKRTEEAHLVRLGANNLNSAADSIDPTLANVGAGLAGLGQILSSQK